MKPLSVLISLIATLSVALGDAEKPNFIVINIDDLGYGDIGPFGSTLNRTPHLDRLAKEGRKLTSFYAAPVCSPSRAALMTGSQPRALYRSPRQGACECRGTGGDFSVRHSP